MITIGREGSKVKVIIDPGLHDGNTAWLYWECNSDWYAELLVERIRNKFNETIRTIREEEYNCGWSDKSKHKTKNTWFSSLFRRVHNQ